MKEEIKVILVVLLLVATSIIVIQPISEAADIKDQYQETASMYTSVYQVQRVVQTFTPSLALLKYVQTYGCREGSPTGTITLRVRTNGFSGLIVASSSKDISTISTTPDWITWDFADVTITVGNLYYISIIYTGGDGLNLYRSYGVNTNNYAGGTYWVYMDGTYVEFPSADMTFRTYADNTAPTLSSPSVDPQQGSQSTYFTFTVKYTDVDNQAPTIARCYYTLPGRSEGYGTMSAGSGAYRTGKWYTYTAPALPLADDTGYYYFYFTDSYDVSVSTSSYPFTVHTNQPPFYITNISVIPSYFYRGQQVAFNAVTTDPEGEQIRYGWNWTGGTTVDTWSSFKLSNTTSSTNHTYTLLKKQNFSEGFDNNIMFSQYNLDLCTSSAVLDVFDSTPDVDWVWQTDPLKSWYRYRDPAFNSLTTILPNTNYRINATTQCIFQIGTQDFTSIPTYVQVKPEDSNGLSNDFTPKSISLFNKNPVSTFIGGSGTVGIDTSYTCYVRLLDDEGDNMKVTVLWGDGESNVTGYYTNNTNVSFVHTYSSEGIKTITCTIEDEFMTASAGGTTTLYKYIIVQGVPDAPTIIDTIGYNQLVIVKWIKPTSVGGQPVLTYNLKWWQEDNLTLPLYEEDNASFIYEIPYTNASDSSGSGHNVTGLTNNITYNFRISCNNTYGQSSWSDIVTGTPGHTNPTTPYLQLLSVYSGQVLDLYWSQPTFYDASVLEKYYILISENGTIYIPLGNTTLRIYHITGLTNGLTYFFKVYATDNQSGQSSYSNVVSTTIDDVNPSEPILSELSTFTYSLSVTLTWTESTDATSGVSRYVVQEDTTRAFSNPTNTYEGLAITTSFASNHEYGKTYYYRIRAIDGAGNPSVWNGPVQTTLKSNESVKGEYSKIEEIWFHSRNIVVNQPIYVTITVENTYSIPTGNVKMKVRDTEEIMRLTDITSDSYKFSVTWTPLISGEVDFELTVLNSNFAVNSISIPIEILTSSISTDKSTVKVFEHTDDVVVATFSESQYNVSAYKDVLNEYHVSFGTKPLEETIIDLTNLEPSVEVGYLWFIRVSWLDSRQLKCMVYGNNQIINFKLSTGYKVRGYNDWNSKWFGWIIGKSFTLVEETSSYITLSTLERELVAKL